MSDAAVHAGEHPSGAAAGHEPHVNYMAKFYWLVGLTAAEVVVAMKVEGAWLPILLAFLSCWKAAIVLQYFMHLKSEGRALKLLMAFPAVLILVLVLLFMADGVWLRYASY